MITVDEVGRRKKENALMVIRHGLDARFEPFRRFQAHDLLTLKLEDLAAMMAWYAELIHGQEMQRNEAMQKTIVEWQALCKVPALTPGDFTFGKPQAAIEGVQSGDDKA